MWGPLGAMVDSGSDHTDRGVVPRVFQNLFSRIQRVRKLFTCSLLFVNSCDHVDWYCLSRCRRKRALLRSRPATNAGARSLRCVVICLFSTEPCLGMVSALWNWIRNETYICFVFQTLLQVHNKQINDLLEPSQHDLQVYFLFDKEMILHLPLLLVYAGILSNFIPLDNRECGQ